MYDIHNHILYFNHILYIIIYYYIHNTTLIRFKPDNIPIGGIKWSIQNRFGNGGQRNGQHRHNNAWLQHSVDLFQMYPCSSPWTSQYNRNNKALCVVALPNTHHAGGKKIAMYFWCQIQSSYNKMMGLSHKLKYKFYRSFNVLIKWSF